MFLRILTFGQTRIFWECLEGFQASYSSYFSAKYLYGTTDRIDRFPFADCTEFHPEAGHRAETNWSSWYALIANYGRRHVTKNSDKLVAFPAIAEKYSILLKDEGCFARHFRSILPFGLC